MTKDEIKEIVRQTIGRRTELLLLKVEVAEHRHHYVMVLIGTSDKSMQFSSTFMVDTRDDRLVRERVSALTEIGLRNIERQLKNQSLN